MLNEKPMPKQDAKGWWWHGAWPMIWWGKDWRRCILCGYWKCIAGDPPKNKAE